MRWPRFICSLCDLLFGFNPNDPPDVREYDRARRRFNDDARRRGLTYDEMARELRLREAIARIQRKASDWTLQRPHDAWEAIRVETDNACRGLDKAEVRILLDAVRKMGQHDLLYPEALAAAEAADRATAAITRRSMPTEDQIAALRRR